jgi:DNA-binding NarL/FixJ family response regulator
MRVLHITGRKRTGAWLAEALAADNATEIHVDQSMGSAAGLARLRDEVFDAVLVSHVPGELDSLELTAGYRAGGADEPIIVLGTESEQEMAVPCFEAGADGYLCVNTTTTRALIWVVARAIHRHQLAQENRRFNQAEQTRLQREHDEVDRLLDDQWRLVADPGPAGTRAIDPHQAPRLPGELISHYRELLRTYVIMGSGNLADELRQLADLLVCAGLGVRQVMHLHLYVLQELVHGLGMRSARHVLSRADLLSLELTLHMADGYRRRHDEYVRPPVQRLLPGFNATL